MIIIIIFCVADTTDNYYNTTANTTITAADENTMNNTTTNSSNTEGSGDTSYSSGDDNNFNYTDDNYNDFIGYHNISIYLPPAVFENLTDTRVGLLFSYYRTPILFPLRNVSNDSYYPVIASPVIGAALAEQEAVVNLTDNIIITIPYTAVSIIATQ